MSATRASADRFRLYRLQLGALVRQELARLVQPGALGLVLVAALPAVFVLLHIRFERGPCTIARDTEILAALFQFFTLRIALFLACLAVFGGMFRREVMQKTLHHLFLAPVRRELLVLGKFAGAWLSVFTVYGISWLATFALMYGHLGAAGGEFVRHGPGLLQLAAYLGTLALGALGFGAVFLAVGLTFRNPTIPAVVLLAAESFSALLPGWLQRLTVTFYLKFLLPIQLPDEGPSALFSFVVEPVSPTVAVAGLCGFALVVLVLACWRVRHLEVNYSSD
jgi:ABC-type transport system involved in multi-copper enzyme maturation permease subunit